MRVSIVFSVILLISIFNLSSARRYFSEEEKRNDNKKFAFIPDDEGHIHFVNLQNQHREVDFQVVPEDITVYFHSVENPTIGLKFSADNFDGIVNHHLFNPNRKTVFVTHGWTGLNTSHSCRTAKDAFLVKDEANVFIVDWKRPAHEFYTVARGAVSDIGAIIGGFVDKFLEVNNIDADNVMLIGNSLGAHVMGATGAAMKKKPGVIMGLDPANPLFYIDEPDKRLDITDGKLVHIVHTNAGFLGFKSSIGHADYFANGGGQRQPGCEPDIFGYCAHTRSVDYYVESINSDAFKSTQCDSFEDYMSGACDGNQVSSFGGLNLDLEAHGDFYFNTNAKSPYAQN